MKEFFDKAIHAVAQIAAVLTRLWEKRSGRLETLNRKQMEAERLDRLRNPSNYQGR
jgi:hypothetical protein